MSAIPPEGSDTARLREAALREILGVISQSRDDDKPVFDAIVQSAARLCNAPMAWLLLTDADQSGMVLAGYHGLNRRKIALGDTWPLNREPDTITGVGRAILGLRTVQEEDLARTAHYLNGTSDMRLLVDDEGVRTRLSVPLVSGGKGIGAIILSRRDVALFGPDETALVETFAAQAVIAIENVRQFRELQTRLAREAASAEILEVISQSRDDDRPVFDVVLRKAAELCHASMAGLNVRSEDGGHAVMVAEWGDHVTDLRPVGETAWPMESDHAPSKCIREGRIVHVHDLKDTDLYRSGDPIRVAAVDTEGIRTFLAVPLSSGGATIRCITIYRREVRPFTPDEIALVETFAAQAVIAIENVRQFRELRDSLEQQEATSDILRAISQSREDETQVFDLILEKAAVLCDADQSSLQIVNEARTHIRHMADWGHDRTAYHPGAEYSLDLPLSLVATIRAAKVVHIEDYSQSDAYKDRHPIAVGLVETEGVRTRLNVPLLQNRIAIGCISLSRRAVRPFTPDEIALVETFAAQAVIAIENARQFRELQTRLAREAATREILEVISQSRDDDAPVFEAVLRNANRLCGTSMAYLVLGRPDDTHMTLAAYVNPHLPSEDSVDRIIAFANQTGMRMDAAEHFSARAIVSGKVVQIADLTTSPGYLSGEPTTRILVEDVGVRTILSVPMFDVQGAIGAISLQRREERPFSDDEIALIQSFAAQASIAIGNVRQFRALQTRLEREKASGEILQVISQSRDDDGPVFDVIAQNAARLCGAAVCSFWRIEHGMIHYCASYGLTGDVLAEVQAIPAMPLFDNMLTGQVVKARAVVRIEDATAESYFNHEWARARGLKHFIGVPIFVRDDVWGSITLMWPADRAPQDADISLVEGFAAQASIAIENVRQFRELQVRLAREAATREILEVISQSRDDDKPVFDVVLRKAAELCHASMADLNILSEDRTHAVLTADWGDIHSDKLPVGTVWPMDSDRGPQISLREGRIRHVHDLADTDAYRSGDRVPVIAVDEIGIRTVLTVPLFSGGQTVACISIYRREVRPFTPDEIALVETFAAQAVIAIENVRQFRELQDRLAREEATRQILQVISQSRDDETPVFDAILDRAERLCDAGSSALLLVDEARSHLVLAATRGMRSSADIGETQPLTSGHTSSDAILTGAVVQVLDVRDTELYRNGDPLRVELVDKWGLRTSMAVPLMRDGVAIGAFTVMRLHKARAFSDNDIRLLEAFAAQAVIAIENVRQFRALEALNAELGERVQDQVGQIERMGRLKRFLPAAVADAVVSSGSEKLLSSHRALLGVLFCDIRGFTAFCETAEPEETIEVLQTYHEEMGRLIAAHGAGVDHRIGDGIMVLFNDPLPCDDPAGNAVRLAMAMRGRMAELCARWKKMGHRLGFGVGISLGYATVGMVGSGGRQDYTASGTAVNLAARLCDEALDGEILISPRAATAVEGSFAVEGRGERSLKGIREPVELFCVAGVVGA